MREENSDDILELQRWVQRDPSPRSCTSPSYNDTLLSAENTSSLQNNTPSSHNLSGEPALLHDSWEKLKSDVAHCTACPLHLTRTQTVFGVGNQQAELMFIGEAPGYHEDQQGEPFVGRAGQLLTAMLKSIGLTREEVYIANILKSRPPNNRDPQPEEVSACTPFLLRQIALVKPRLLIAVGRISAHYLLQTRTSLESLRHKMHYYSDQRIPLLVTYHPAYLLRNPADKKKAYADLLKIKEALKR